MRYRFEGWTLDTDTRELRSGDGTTHLPRKAFDLLALLLECRPRAIAKSELQERLWPDTFVSDATLSSLVADLRSALGDGARKPRFIRTVHGHGYAFCGAAEEEGAAHDDGDDDGFHYRLYVGRREVTLEPGENVLGRTKKAAIWIDSTSVSRRHARIVIDGGDATIEDLGSKNGTFVDGTPVEGVVSLSDGDEVRVGSVSMRFRQLTPGGETETTPRSQRSGSNPARRRAGDSS